MIVPFIRHPHPPEVTVRILVSEICSALNPRVVYAGVAGGGAAVVLFYLLLAG